MTKNLFAHTEPGGSLPAYVSINRDENHRYSISVRARGQDCPSVIEVTPELLEVLACELLARLGVGDAEAPAAQPAPQAPLDVCTDPGNCRRCKAAQWDKHKFEHAGIAAGVKEPA